MGRMKVVAVNGNVLLILYLYFNASGPEYGTLISSAGGPGTLLSWLNDFRQLCQHLQANSGVTP
jgi:hypothetical protein